MFETLTLKSAMYVAHNMRQRDKDSLDALIGASNPDTFAIGRWQMDGAAWAMIESNPVAIGGIAMPVPWVGHFWLVCTDDMTMQSWKKLIRQTRTILRNASKTVQRLEADVLSDWPEAERLVHHLGFELEGTRKKAGRDGQDILTFTYKG